EVDHVGGEPFRGGLERDPGPGGVLEKQVDDRAPAQGGQLLDRAIGQAGQFLGGVEDEQRVAPAEIGRRDEMAFHDGRPSSLIITASCASTSASKTCTTSRCEVGRFLPT